MSTADLAKKRDASSRARRRTKEKDEDDKAERDQFHNYKPPLRLLVLELTIIILLIILLLIKPSGFSAISQSGNDRVGLLSNCSGSSCTSWLGAPAGGTTSAAATKRQLGTGTEAAGAEAPATDSTSSSSATSSSPTSFHLQTGLAAFCSLVLVSYAFIIHLIRLREEPPPAGTESDIDPEKRKKSRFRKCCTPFANFDFNGVKRGGYRISRLFTVVNVSLLLCVCIAAGVQASSAGFAPGFVLLVFSWVMLLLVALMEFLDERRKVSTWLMFYRGRLRCGGDRGSSSKNEDLEKGSEMKQMERDRPLRSPKATHNGRRR